MVNIITKQKKIIKKYIYRNCTEIHVKMAFISYKVSLYDKKKNNIKFIQIGEEGIQN